MDDPFGLFGTFASPLAAPPSPPKKIILRKFINEKLIEKAYGKGTIKPVAEFYRKHQTDIMDFMIDAFTKAPAGTMADYVWNYVNPKFMKIAETLVSFAQEIEKDRANISHAVLTDDDKKIIELQRKRVLVEEKQEEPVKKKALLKRDPRGIEPSYKEPTSMFADIVEPSLPIDTTYVLPRSVRNVVNSNLDISSSSTPNGSASISSSSNGTSYASRATHEENLPPSDPSSSSARKNVGFSDAASTATTSKRRKEKMPSPPPQPADSDKDEQENEDDSDSSEPEPVRRPRDLSRYLNARTGPPPEIRYPYNRPQEDDQPMNGSSTQSSPDRRAEEARRFDEFYPEIPAPQLLPRPTVEKEPAIDFSALTNESRDYEPSTHPDMPSPSPAPRARNDSTPQRTSKSTGPSFFDSDTEEPEPEASRKVSFGGDVAEKNRVAPDYEIQQAHGTPMVQPHETVDYQFKPFMSGTNPSGIMTAFPNQISSCERPAPKVLESWIATPNFEDGLPEVFASFRCKNYPKKDYDNPPPQTLFIFDQMLSGINFENTYKNVAVIDSGYPNDPYRILQYLKSEIAAKRNDYLMKNVIVCVGLDMLVHDPDLKRAVKTVKNFNQELIKSIAEAFAPNGPKRLRPKNLKPDDDGEELEVDRTIDAPPPRIIFITIPQVTKAVMETSFAVEIDAMNKMIRDFQQSCAQQAKKYHVVLEVYDWENECRDYKNCNKKDLETRNGILMRHFAEEYGIQMMPRTGNGQ